MKTRHLAALMVFGGVGTGIVAAAPREAHAPVNGTPISQLWVDPIDLEQRDLFHGIGGRENKPDPNVKFKVVGVKQTGTQPGLDVEDPAKREWSTKLGIEARTEVFMSRIVWAVGFHQPMVYYVPRWTSVDSTGRETTHEAARFRLEPPHQDKVGEWPWRSNPFVGTRQLNGLYALMVMFNNWDLKGAQNAIYKVTSGGDTTTWYMVRDLGASLGKSKWLSFGSKDDPVGFEEEEFIDYVEGNRVYFGFQGSWLEPTMLGAISPGDVRWISGLLNRITQKQWEDAFRAGGFAPEEGARYLKRIREKIREGLNVEG
jgi:hypothetical protein